MSFTSNYSNEKNNIRWMAVPKKHTYMSKKNIRKTFWKKMGYWTALKAFSLAQSIFTRNAKSFFCNKYKHRNNLN